MNTGNAGQDIHPRWLWPAVRAKVTRPDETSVLDAMEAEHLHLEPLLSRADAALVAGDLADLAEGASALATALTAHMEHEEVYAPPPRWVTAAV
jgi:Hemerythrin HHE cation binding domain